MPPTPAEQEITLATEREGLQRQVAESYAFIREGVADIRRQIASPILSRLALENAEYEADTSKANNDFVHRALDALPISMNLMVLSEIVTCGLKKASR